jgi:Ca-activated chloride channel family protein
MKPRYRWVLALLGLECLALPSAARSQGLVIDRRPHHPIARSYEIREVSVDARVRDQVAEVQISQTFHNPGSFVLESEYFFPLPEEGAIQNFVLMVDGKELPGRLLDKDEARRIYEEIVRTKRDPALLEYMGRGLYRTSVFPIPPGADRKVTMRYTQLCKRDRERVEFSYPFSTQKFTTKPIQRLVLNVRIENRESIKSVYSPSFDAEIKREGEHGARVRFEEHDTVPTRDFRLVYTLAEGALGASVLSYRPSRSEDGYFLLLASPRIKPSDVSPQPKTVIFVLDRSGSMAGKKIEQARKALHFVLDNLREGDLFNIVDYDDRVETFRPELERYSSRTRREAERYVDNIREGGATNIDAALKTALGQIRDDSRPSYVLFLTDGLPTAGETNELAIARECRKANKEHARVFVFGVGYDVNARLLDRLSGGNSGTSVYVKPDEDIETHLARFYAKMTSPVLHDIRIALSRTDVNRTYPREVPDLFEGGQLVWVGRYRRGGAMNVTITGKVGSERRRFEFPIELADEDRGSAHEFVARIWAMRRVGDIIDQIDLNGKNSELVDELVALSKRYGILTPYTSFLADERTPLHARLVNKALTLESLRELNVVTGASGVQQRSFKQGYLEAENLARQNYQVPAGAAMMPGIVAGGAQAQMAGRPTDMYKSRARRRGAVAEPAGTPGAGQATEGQVRREAEAQGNQAGDSAVRQLGAKTFYFKNNRWVDSTVTPEQERRATEITQFSDAYFRLARSQSAELNQYLAFDAPVTVELGGQVYRIEQAKP